MRASARRAVSIASLAMVLASVLVAGPASAATTPLNTSLTDPGAESAAGTDGTAVVPVPGWVTEAGFTAAAYGALNCPSSAESARIGGGGQMFYGGARSVATARQQIVLKGRAAAIDAGRMKVTVSAQIAVYDGQGDSGRVQVRFLRADGTQLGTVQTAAVSATNLVMRRVTANRVLPAGTRRLEVVLVARRLVGDWNDAFFDNIDVRIKPA